MKLTARQQQKFLKAFAKTKPKCPLCGGIEFELLDAVYEVREFDGTRLPLGGDVSLVPFLLTVCKKCGRMESFNALTLGIIDEERVVRNGKQD